MHVPQQLVELDHIRVPIQIPKAQLHLVRHGDAGRNKGDPLLSQRPGGVAVPFGGGKAEYFLAVHPQRHPHVVHIHEQGRPRRQRAGKVPPQRDAAQLLVVKIRFGRERFPGAALLAVAALDGHGVKLSPAPVALIVAEHSGKQHSCGSQHGGQQKRNSDGKAAIQALHLHVFTPFIALL